MSNPSGRCWSRAVLEGKGITVLRRCSRVGQNLWDPIQLFSSFPVSTPSAQTLTSNPALVGGFIGQYLDSASGPFSSAAGYLANERLPDDLPGQLGYRHAREARRPAG